MTSLFFFLKKHYICFELAIFHRDLDCDMVQTLATIYLLIYLAM